MASLPQQSAGGTTTGPLGQIFGGILGGPIGGLLGGLGSFFGADNRLSGARNDILSLSQFNPTNFTGSAGTFGFNNGNAVFQQNPLVDLLGNVGAGVGLEGFGGGLFGNPAFQQAFQGADLAGAFQNAQNIPSGGTDVLTRAGIDALVQAGDQSGLIQSTFDSLNALAAPGENLAANRLLDSQFNRGIGQSSVGADERAIQANRFLTAADQRALNATNIGLGEADRLRRFGADAIGSGFQQNLTAGQTRLANAQGLFGFGAQLRDQGISQGFAAQQGLLGNAQVALQAILGSLNAEANRIGGTGFASQALGNLGAQRGGLLGGLLGGLF